MIKKIGLLVVLISISQYVHSETYTYYDVKVLIENKGHMDDFGSMQIRELSAGLSESEKYSLFLDTKKNGWIGFGGNMLVMGLGNVIMGDYVGGILEFLGYSSGITLFYVGGYSYNLTIYGVGLGLMTASLLAGIIRPFTYANKYNNKIKSALGVYYSVDFEPKLTAWNDSLVHVSLLSVSF